MSAEQDFYEDLFGRGDGDPDVYGYPDQEAEETDENPSD